MPRVWKKCANTRNSFGKVNGELNLAAGMKLKGGEEGVVAVRIHRLRVIRA